MTTQIELREMIFHAYHGVLQQEKLVGNTLVVNLLLTADISNAIQSDQLEDTIDYSQLFGLVKDEMSIPYQLLAHVAGRIVHSIKEKYPIVKEITLKLSKLNPPFSGEVHSASIILNEKFR